MRRQKSLFLFRKSLQRKTQAPTLVHLGGNWILQKPPSFFAKVQKQLGDGGETDHLFSICQMIDTQIHSNKVKDW